jgi:Transposase DDE domain group 1
MVDVTLFLPGLSPVQDKSVVARFDGGRLSSEGGLLVLREIERRLGLADRLAGCLKDPRMPEKVVHRLAEIIRFRMLMIAAGYEDGNDAYTLRSDPMFKLALDRLPSGEELCSQSTVSRLENLPDLRALLRLGRALVEQYCGSFRAVPKRVVLDIDDTFDRVHGGQQLRLFNAYYDDYGFQPIVVFDGEGRFVTARLRPGKRPGRGGDSQLCAPPHRHHPRPLAPGRDSAARRQPLLSAGSIRLVPGKPGRLGLRPGRQCGALPPCHGVGEEHWRTLQDVADPR